MLAAAGVFAAAFQTWSFANSEDMPVGRAENKVVVIDDDTAEKLENSIAADNENAVLYDETDSARFFEYGINSRYAYQDMLKRDNAENKRKFYDELYDLCVSFENDRKDITPQTINGEVYYPIEICNIDYDLSVDEVSEVYFPFMYDHPEFYWLDLGVLTATDRKGKLKQVLICAGSDCVSGEERSAYDLTFDSKLEDWLEDIRSKNFCCNYTTAEYLQDIICDEVKYGYNDSGVALNTHYAHTIIGVLDDNPETDAVCEGYAKTFRLALNALRVENAYGVSKSHAWNYIKLDDKYYGVDVTWDDNLTDRHKYFAKGTKVFNRDPSHTLLTSDNTGIYFLYDMPELAEDDYVHIHTIPTDTPKPTEIPESDETAEPEETFKPYETAEPTGIPRPTQIPAETAEPTKTQEPDITEEPTKTQEPDTTAEPTKTQEPDITAEPTDAPKPYASIEQINMKDDDGNDLAGFEFEWENVPQGSSIYAVFYDEDSRLTRVVINPVSEPEKHIRWEIGFGYRQGYEISARAMIMTADFEPLCSSIAAELK